MLFYLFWCLISRLSRNPDIRPDFAEAISKINLFVWWYSTFFPLWKKKRKSHQKEAIKIFPKRTIHRIKATKSVHSHRIFPKQNYHICCHIKHWYHHHTVPWCWKALSKRDCHFTSTNQIILTSICCHSWKYLQDKCNTNSSQYISTKWRNNVQTITRKQRYKETDRFIQKIKIKMKTMNSFPTSAVLLRVPLSLLWSLKILNQLKNIRWESAKNMMKKIDNSRGDNSE